MKIFMLPVVVLFMVAAVTLCSTGCKKSAPDYLLTSLVDSGQIFSTFYTYDLDGNVTLAYDNISNYIFYYAADRLIKRTFTNNGDLSNVDSFYYDEVGRLAEVVDYDAANNKQKTTLFAYNADNTVNNMTVNYVLTSVSDELYQYTYNGGKLTERDDYYKISGAFKIVRKFEFLAYDGRTNPFSILWHISFADQPNGLYFTWCGPGNVTSITGTNYNTTTGNITSVSSLTGTYTYNSGGLPVSAKYAQGTTSNTIQYTYTEK